MVRTVSKTNVVFLITKSNWGGAQRYVYDLTTNLPTDQFEVSVFLGGTGPLVEKLATAGITVTTIPSLQRDISISKELRSFWEIYKLVKAAKPDVFHINSSKAGGIGAFIGRLAGVPRIIFTSHAWAFNEDRPWWQKPILKFFHWLTVILSHQTIAVSKAIKDQMNWPGAQSKMTVVHNGRAIPDYFPRVTARELLTTYAPALAEFQSDIWTGTIAELHPVKRHDLMINAVAELVPEFPTLRHLIIGTGELTEELTSLIKEKQLHNHVFLLGHVDEAARFLKALDMFVLPSRSEALAYTAIEAAQAGIPSIVSNVGGLPEIVTHEHTGLMFARENQIALTKILRRMLRNPDEQAAFGAAAQADSQRFTLETMVTHTIACYNAA